MISPHDLEVLRTFNSRGRCTLSVYLKLDSPQQRDSAYNQLSDLVRLRLDQYGADPECRDAVREDLEIIGLYLKTNGYRQHRGLAIFSCAAELFWRAYPLETPVPTQAAVGPAFDLGPLVHHPAAS